MTTEKEGAKERRWNQLACSMPPSATLPSPAGALILRTKLSVKRE